MPVTPQPEHITAQMRLWRIGDVPFPQDFIDWHKGLAEASLESVKPRYVVHSTWMENDGWGDPMMILYAVVEKQDSHIPEKIHWHPGNQGWMIKLPRGGSVIWRFE